ncbi:MAG: hypothetical protein AAFZ07_16450 [Actinomycetota bacterium]
MTLSVVLAQASTERVDEPVGLLVVIAVLLAVLGVLIAALAVLYVRATRPRPTPQPVAPASEPTTPPAPPVSDAGTSAAPPPRRRSPVLRSRTSLWRR